MSFADTLRTEIENVVKKSFASQLEQFISIVSTETKTPEQELIDMWRRVSSDSIPSKKSPTPVSTKKSSVTTVASLKQMLTEMGVSMAGAKTKADLQELVDKHSNGGGVKTPPKTEDLKMTVAQLRDKMTSLGIPIPKNAKKSDLEELVRSHEKSAASAVVNEPVDELKFDGDVDELETTFEL